MIRIKQSSSRFVLCNIIWIIIYDYNKQLLKKHFYTHTVSNLELRESQISLHKHHEKTILSCLKKYSKENILMHIKEFISKLL